MKKVNACTSSAIWNLRPLNWVLKDEQKLPGNVYCRVGVKIMEEHQSLEIKGRVFKGEKHWGLKCLRKAEK